MNGIQADIEAVVFDFDGVIADTARDIAGSVQATQRHYGVPEMSRETIISFVGWGAPYLIKNTIPIDAQEEALKWYKEYYKQHPCDDTVLFPGVREMLEKLRKNGIYMGIVSNKPEPITRRITDLMAITEHFTLIVGPESVGRMKPEPDGLLLCVEAFERAAGRRIDMVKCMMVGDSFTDIQAGRNASFGYTCAMTYGYGDREKLLAQNADLVTDDMMKVAGFVLGSRA